MNTKLYLWVHREIVVGSLQKPTCPGPSKLRGIVVTKWAALREKVPNVLSRCHIKRYDTDLSKKKKKKKKKINNFQKKIFPEILKSWCHTKRRAGVAIRDLFVWHRPNMHKYNPEKSFIGQIFIFSTFRDRNGKNIVINHSGSVVKSTRNMYASVLWQHCHWQCGSPPGVNDGWHTEFHC